MLPKGGDILWSIGADFPEMSSSGGSSTSSKSSIPSEFQEAIKKNLFVITDNLENGENTNKIECNKNELLNPQGESVVNKALELIVSGLGQTTKNVIDFLLTWGGGMGPSLSSAQLYSFSQDPSEEPSTRTWHDISKTPLPHAPNMKIYCLYGVGVDTERAFFYKGNYEEQRLFGVDNSSDDSNPRKLADPPIILDTNIEDPENGIVHGIKYSDGDGSVPLLSLGYMCAGPWRNQKSGMNPSGSQIITREYAHRAEFVVDDPMRKGPNSAEHVDVLGNKDMMQDFVKIVSDEGVDSLTDNVVSNINDIVKRINNHEDWHPTPVQQSCVTHTRNLNFETTKRGKESMGKRSTDYLKIE